MKTSLKVSEILQSGMVNDDTLVYIDKPSGATSISRKFKGNWYQDYIMDFAEDEITKLTYIQKENKIYMEVKS